jgi:hypothetical protein
MIKPKIEIAPEQYWRVLTVDEARMYCFALTIDGKTGWRLPTRFEYIRNPGIAGWDISYGKDWKINVSPVRDLKDD